MNKKNYKLLALSAVALLLSACNGGGGGQSEGQQSGGSNSQGGGSGGSQGGETNGNIGSALDLLKITNAGKEVTGEYQLTADITYDSFYSDEYAATIFSGKLEGNGHTITILSESLCDTGIFYRIGENGEVNNLKIKGVIVAAKLHPSVGSLANYNDGLIKNITTYGENLKSGTSTYDDGISSTGGTLGDYTSLATGGGAGGIVGTNNGSVKNCVNNMRVSAVVGGGGIAGLNNGLISECYNIGAIGTTGAASSNVDPTYDYSCMGGIAGVNYGKVEKCMNKNQVFAARYYKLYPKTDEQRENDEYSSGSNYRIRIGGIVGMNVGAATDGVYTGGIITESMNFGRVHGDRRVGGIVGETSGSVTNCMSSCFLGARESLGGIAGYQSEAAPGEVKNCLSISRIQSNTRTIQLEDGTTITAPALTDNKGTETISNIVNYYKVARVADNCLGHNNCGEINPVGENNVTSTGNYAQDKFEASVYNADIWSEYVDNPAEIAALNGSYQVFLHSHLKWQEVSVKVVGLDKSEQTLTLIKGMDYTDVCAVATGPKYSGTFTGINYGCNLGVRGDSELANLGQTPNDGMKIVFLTEQGNKASMIDVITSDATLYAAQVAAE